MHRRSEDLLVVLQPALPKGGDGDGFETEGGRRADRQLGIDLGGELPSDRAVGADARPMPLAILVVAEVPDAAAEIGLHLADAERSGLTGHDFLRECSRY